MVQPLALQAAILALPALSMAAATPKDVELNARIVGGKPAKHNEFPSTVAIKAEGTQSCGGALLNEWTVLTAAHCFINKNETDGTLSVIPARDFSVRAGTLTWPHGGVQVDVDSVTLHPHYNHSNLENDVALMELNYPIYESDTVSFGQLIDEEKIPRKGSRLHLAGWGLTSDGGESSKKLLKAIVPAISMEKCRHKLGGGNVTDDMFCGGYDKGGIDSCQGDSGGPVYNDDMEIVGVVSWGNGCAQANSPGVYARVGYFLDWIKKEMWDNVKQKGQQS